MRFDFSRWNAAGLDFVIARRQLCLVEWF